MKCPTINMYHIIQQTELQGLILTFITVLGIGFFVEKIFKPLLEVIKIFD